MDSDASPGGLPDINIKKVSAHLQSLRHDNIKESSIYNNMMSRALEKYKQPSSEVPPWKKFNAEVVNILIDGILYEPTNVKGPINPYNKQ